jgi:hypothetical protein
MVSFIVLSLVVFSDCMMTRYTVHCRLLSLISSLQRHFLLVTFDENASNGSIWIRLVRAVPTRVSSLLSARFFSPSRRLTFDENASNCSYSIRLVQGFPTLVSKSKSDSFLIPLSLFPSLRHHFFLDTLIKMLQIALFGSTYSRAFQPWPRNQIWSYPSKFITY